MRRHVGVVFSDSVADVMKILQVLQRSMLNKLVLDCPDALRKQFAEILVAETDECVQPLGSLFSSSKSKLSRILARCIQDSSVDSEPEMDTADAQQV